MWHPQNIQLAKIQWEAIPKFIAYFMKEKHRSLGLHMCLCGQELVRVPIQALFWKKAQKSFGIKTWKILQLVCYSWKLWFTYIYLCTTPDPYVKASLICDGRRLKKRKTSTKRNTLNPVYNEAIVFDVPPENIDQISLLIAVMDYDRLVFQNHVG